jgi:Trk K+ transport system NAD-binding subunit
MARTTSSIFLFLRRLRRPLLVLIASYAVCTLGMVLIPGVDAEGRTVHLDFLHAFYIISYTGSTIGYGEIPNAFTPAQRVWMTFTMYVAVTAWLYSIGSIIATLTDPGFRRLILERRFAAQVRGIGQPFYLVCGYGHTGSLVVRELRRYEFGVVVIDDAQERLDELALLDLGTFIPSLCGDVTKPDLLVAAGLTSRRCIGVLGLAASDDANLAVAMAARLLNPDVPAICRSQSADTTANMASFGTRHIVNPFSAFAERVGLTYRAPSAHVIYECLTSSHRTPAAKPTILPLGRWVVCGHGRFGAPLAQQLVAAGNEVTVIESNPERAPAGAVIGRGTEAVTLLEAGIDTAVGIVAGTDHGINNLSIIVTAQELQPTIFTIAREVVRDQQLLFLNAGLDLRVNLAYLAASEAVELLRNPLLPMFLDQLMRCDEGWAAALLRRLTDTIGDYSPDTWVVALTPESAPALLRASTTWPATSLDLLLRDPRDRSRMLAAVPLLVRRGKDTTLLPDDRFVLRPGDQLLFCGRMEAQKRMHWARRDIDVLSYIATGVERPSGWVWQRRARRSA